MQGKGRERERAGTRDGGREGREKRTVYKLSRKRTYSIDKSPVVDNVTSSNEAIYTLKSYFQEDIQIWPWISYHPPTHLVFLEPLLHELLLALGEHGSAQL